MGILSDGSVCGDSGGIALSVVPRVSALYERARESESGSLLKPGGQRGKDQKSSYGAGGGMYQRCLLLDVGAGYKLYPGMEPGKSFSGTRCENSEGVCVGDGKENRESSKGKAEKMIYIGLVDDECEHLMKMRTFLQQYEEEHNTKFSIQEFHNGLNFVEDYKGDLDIVFLNKLEKAIRFAKLKVEKELVLQTEDRFLAEQDPEL